VLFTIHFTLTWSGQKFDVERVLRRFISHFFVCCFLIPLPAPVYLFFTIFLACKATLTCYATTADSAKNKRNSCRVALTMISVIRRPEFILKQFSNSFFKMSSTHSPLLERAKACIPKLGSDRHKGQAGRIGEELKKNIKI
jgi:hypothetical protein